MRKIAIGLSALATLSMASAWGADLPTKKPNCPQVTIEHDRALLNGQTRYQLLSYVPNTEVVVGSGSADVDVRAAAALEPNARAEVRPGGGEPGSLDDLSSVARQIRDRLIANPGDIAEVVKEAAAANSATRLEMELGIVRAIRYTECYDPAGYQALSNFMKANANDPVVAATQATVNQVATNAAPVSAFPAANAGGGGTRAALFPIQARSQVRTRACLASGVTSARWCAGLLSPKGDRTSARFHEAVDRLAAMRKAELGHVSRGRRQPAIRRNGRCAA